MKLPAGPFVAWGRPGTGMSCASGARGGERSALKLSREIDVVGARGRTRQLAHEACAAIDAPPRRDPQLTLGGVGADRAAIPRTRGALFLRADRLEGTRGARDGGGPRRAAVAPRDGARRLAVIRDSRADDLMAKATSCCDAATTGSPDREVEYKRDTEVGFFREAAIFRFGSERARRRERDPLHRPRSLRSDRRELHDVRRAAHRLVSARRGARGRQPAQGRHCANDACPCISSTCPFIYAPWLQFPLSNERKSGFLTPTLGSTGVRGFEATAPYYLNLAPNYDATITPRLMTKRGMQLGGAVPLSARRAPKTCSAVAAGEMNAEILPHDRVDGRKPVRARVEAHRTVRAVARRFFQHQQGLGRQLFRRFRRPGRRDVAEDAAARRRARRTSGPWSLLARVQSFQTLQDPNAAGRGPPYNRLPQTRVR